MKENYSKIFTYLCKLYNHYNHSFTIFTGRPIDAACPDHDDPVTFYIDSILDQVILEYLWTEYKIPDLFDNVAYGIYDYFCDCKFNEKNFSLEQLDKIICDVLDEEMNKEN